MGPLHGTSLRPGERPSPKRPAAHAGGDQQSEVAVLGFRSSYHTCTHAGARPEPQEGTFPGPLSTVCLSRQPLSCSLLLYCPHLNSWSLPQAGHFAQRSGAEKAPPCSRWVGGAFCPGQLSPLHSMTLMHLTGSRVELTFLEDCQCQSRGLCQTSQLPWVWTAPECAGGTGNYRVKAGAKLTGLRPAGRLEEASVTPWRS